MLDRNALEQLRYFIDEAEEMIEDKERVFANDTLKEFASKVKGKITNGRIRKLGNDRQYEADVVLKSGLVIQAKLTVEPDGVMALHGLVGHDPGYKESFSGRTLRNATSDQLIKYALVSLGKVISKVQKEEYEELLKVIYESLG